MTLQEIQQRLRVYDDPSFRFDEGEHVYTYNNRKFESVTTFIHKFEKPFDTDRWSRVIAERREVDVQVILDEWKNLTDIACEVGTLVHKYIEDKFSGLNPVIDFGDPVVNERVERVDKFIMKRLSKLTPVAQEIRIFSKRLKLAGTIDALFLHEGKLYILDWKTNKRFRTDDDKCYQKLEEPFHDYWSNEHNRYSMQLSLYKLMLAEQGIEVEDCVLVYIPPLDTPSMYKCKDMAGIFERYFGVSFIGLGEKPHSV
jgi:ATP-dependent exoDNAse (exonuclease V) beta subunit